MRISPARWAYVLCLVPIMALGQQVNPPQPQPASIVGSIIDVQNGAIPSATVIVTSPDPAEHVTVTADESGFFAFKDLRPAVPYRLTRHSPNGFAKWTSPAITLQPGQNLDLGRLPLSISVVQPTVTAMSSEQIATQEVKVEEKQRVIGIFPNFYTVYTPNPAPLTTKLKYQLAPPLLRRSRQHPRNRGLCRIQPGSRHARLSGRRKRLRPALRSRICRRLHRHHDRRSYSSLAPPSGPALLLPGNRHHQVPHRPRRRLRRHVQRRQTSRGSSTTPE